MDTELELTPTNLKEILICADSCQDGVLSGRLLFPGKKPEAFPCLSRCLLRIEALLNEDGHLQSYTEPRTFRDVRLPDCMPTPDTGLPNGALATFHLQILYRRNTSWQGKVLWIEKEQVQSFRSVLELMILIDSGIRE